MMRPHNDRGSILISALVLITVMMVLGMALVSAGSGELQMAAADLRGAKALNLAEAGVAKAMFELTNNSGWNWKGTAEDVTLDDGHYKVSVTGPTNNLYTITSEGWLGSYTSPTAKRKLVTTVRQDGIPAFARFVLANLEQDSKTTVFPNATINGDVYVYGDLDLKKNADITGTVYSTGTISVSGNGEGKFSTVQNYPKINPLQLSLAQLRAAAAVQLTGDYSLENIIKDSGSKYADGVVIFVDGNVTIKGTISKRVTIIASKTLTINGDMTYAPGAGPIYLIGWEGVAANANSVGLLYSPQNATIGKKITIDGAIVSRQMPDITNHVTVNYDARLSDVKNIPTLFKRDSITMSDWKESYQ